jgi:hypothetical protein
LTGMLTDIGIGRGHLAFTMAGDEGKSKARDFQKVLMPSSHVVVFYIVGVTGTIGFKYPGFLSTGRVEHPMELTLAQMEDIPRTDTMSMHHCIRGWSGIGAWRGIALAKERRHGWREQSE